MTEQHKAFADLVAVDEGRIRSEIYTDPSVFDEEMRSIFGANWVYVGHESQVAEPGDYALGHIGRVPVILVHSEDGRVRALVNRCRHRGATVCQRDHGNARQFRCQYHGWTYASDGSLVGVPYPAGYGEGFRQTRQRELGLEVVPRVEAYRGFVWASFNEDVLPLEEYLGPATDFIDEFLAPSPTGRIRLSAGRQLYGFDGNWKFQMENALDGYHPNFVHRSFATALIQRFGQEGKGIFEKLYGEKSPTLSVALPNGHGVLDQRAFGPLSANERDGGGFNLAIFPNLVFIGAQVRTIRPVAFDRTEVSVSVVVYDGLEDLTEQRLRTHEWFYGPAGFGQPDDAEMFKRMWQGIQGRGGWIDISRGMATERIEPDGSRVGHMVEEIPQRGFYRMWEQLMAGGPGATPAQAGA